MTTQPDWPGRLTRSIAAEVQRRRKARGWSAQRLSDECAKAGMEVARSLITDLELGRRAHISIAEWLVLARALDVAPLLLVFPVGTEAEVEVLPGEVRPTFGGAQWAAGEAPFPGPDDADYLAEIAADWLYATGSPLEIYRAHARAVTEETRAVRRASGMQARAQAATGAESEAFTAAAAALRQTAGTYRTAAENLRRRAKELGLLAPGD
jgi:transcriptional regulator with XRE-family HTH domain